MSFTKILPSDLNARGATTLPNQPTISATALKKEFDAPAKEVVAPAVNRLIDELTDTTAASFIGATAPTGRAVATPNVQTDIDKLSTDLGTLETATAPAILNEHTHTNKALLDTYTQTDSDLADAVSKKHSHSNKSVLDDLSDSGGKLQYKGNSIGDSFKNVVVGGTTVTASNADTITLKAGANVTLAANASTKEVTISSSGGGGGGGGDMYKSDYDYYGDVYSAGGIDGYVAQEIGKLDGTVSGTPGAGNTLTGFSETDGKVTATFGAISITKSQVSDFPSIPSPANSGALNIQQNGVSAYTGGTSFNADSSTAATANIITDDWVAVGSPSGGSVSFTFDDTTYTSKHGFDVYFDVNSGSTNLSPYAKLTGISGEGTSSCTLTYDTDADNGSNTASLRRIK